eukprot:10612265-Ditylum_brightwellii.AAC.1
MMKIIRALYGLKSSGATWHKMIKDTMLSLGFMPCQANPDVWLKPSITPCGFEYYKYVLICVDGILHITHDTLLVMKALLELYELKEGSVREPKQYLGANIKKYQLPDGQESWCM